LRRPADGHLWQALPAARRGRHAGDAQALVPMPTGWSMPATRCWSRAPRAAASPGSLTRFKKWARCARLKSRGAVLNAVLVEQLSDGGDIFNLFRYITFRAGGAFFTALVFGFMFGRPLINLLKANTPGRASRSARTAPKATARPRPARRPWAGC
jgi:hypothetical protein